MTMHWRRMETGKRIDLIKEIYRPGMSASIIAAHIQGASRGAIIGMYWRHRTRLADCPLLTSTHSGKRMAGRFRSEKRRDRSEIEEIRVRSMLAQLIEGAELHTVGVPLSHLGIRQCRFAVNEAEKDEQHLFCGAPAKGSYCNHHRRIAYK